MLGWSRGNQMAVQEPGWFPVRRLESLLCWLPSYRPDLFSQNEIDVDAGGWGAQQWPSWSSWSKRAQLRRRIRLF